ncbi:MAG: ABC transporter ATP-binding protein [Planctomycetes bacterium]|nr:ABC transporter ATP-binding protein [Planctomycetota bacterium]
MSDDFEDDLLEERIKTNVFDPVLLRRMLRYALPYKGRIVAGLCLVLVSSALAISPPLLVGAMVDIVFGTGQSTPGHAVARVLGMFGGDVRGWADRDKLIAFGLLFLFVRTGTFFVDWANTYVLTGFGQRVLYDIRVQLFTHIQNLSLSFFHRNPVGRLVNRVAYDVGALERMFSVAVVTLCKDAMMLTGIVAMLFIIDVQLALIVLSVIPFMVIATLIFRKYSRGAYRRWYTAQSKLNAFMAESMAGVRVVQLFHKQRRNDASYEVIASDFRTHFLAQRRAWAYFRPVATTLSATGIGLVLWVCGDAVLRGKGMEPAEMAVIGAISVGVLVTYLQYAELFFTPIRDITEKFDIVVGAMTSAERIFTILDEKQDVQNLPGAQDFGRAKGEVVFDDVHFEYKADEPVLRGVSFRIEPGQTVAIVGHTGAGKTTIINLVSRFYDVQAGRVLVDGRNTRDYTLKSLRRNIAVVHQDVFLFAGTVLENLRLGDESITRERVVEACAAVGADRFIQRLPGGLESIVEEGGKTFSAGERQLLSFARALVFDPAILILDEATSSIDTHTEEVIQAALKKLTKGRTSIVIAHRLSTVQRADRILVMHKGKLSEQGTHQQLLAERGIYYRLYQLQYSALDDVEKEPEIAVNGELATLPRTSSGALRTAAAATHGNVRRAAEDAGNERASGADA